jgi:hypothetical protein
MKTGNKCMWMVALTEGGRPGQREGKLQTYLFRTTKGGNPERYRVSHFRTEGMAVNAARRIVLHMFSRAISRLWHGREHAKVGDDEIIGA